MKKQLLSIIYVCAVYLFLMVLVTHTDIFGFGITKGYWYALAAIGLMVFRFVLLAILPGMIAVFIYNYVTRKPAQ